MMADNISVTDIATLLGRGFEELASEVKKDMGDIFDLIKDKETRDQWLTQQIRLNHCKDLEGKLTVGGEPITPLQVEQCIAFATGDIARLNKLLEQDRPQAAPSK
jgi:hypothetical protein